VRPNTSSPPPRSRWREQLRLQFIDWRLLWDGRLNRADLTAFFGVSVPQASLDIAAYQALAPEAMRYDRSAKVYVAAEGLRPVFATSDSVHFLNELLAIHTGLTGAEQSFIGWQPPVGLVPSPTRVVPTQTLVALLGAIRGGTALRVMYQSMSSDGASERTITPHALGHDGWRWHVRAWCSKRQRFLDFVIGRVLQVLGSAKAQARGEDDHEWSTLVDIVIVPNPQLSAGAAKAIELDYGMTGGQARLQCRQALLYYALKRLGLDRDGQLQPQAQHIHLKNASEVRAALEGLNKGLD
jgi:hypothetical protein